MRAWMRGPLAMARTKTISMRPRGVGDAHLHGVEVAADVGGVDVAEGDVEGGAGAGDLGRGGDDGAALAEELAHGVAAGDVPEGAVLELARLADDGALAVAVDAVAAAEGGDEAARTSRGRGA